VVWKDHVCNCSPTCHLPNIDGIVNSKLVMVHASLRCMLCMSTCDAIIMLASEKHGKICQNKIPYK